MATHTTPIRHVYEVIDPERYKEVKHYRFVEVTSGKPMLSELLNISKDRNFSKARNVSYWLKERTPDGKKWQHPTTGLKPTRHTYVYYGDIAVNKRPQHLLLFHFTTNAETLVIDFYPNYYPNEMRVNELAGLLKKGNMKVGKQKEGL